MVPIELCMQRCRFQSNAVVPIKSVKRVSAIGVSMRWCRLDRHEQVPISMPVLFSMILCRFFVYLRLSVATRPVQLYHVYAAVPIN